MTVFKAFLKILNKCKFPIIMYTAFLVLFGGVNMQTSDTSTDFVASKPDLLIVNMDNENKVTQNLVNYLTERSNIIKVADNEEARNDALFYRDVNYIIYIPKNYGEDFLNGKNPTIEIKSTGDYQASLSEMLLNKYLKTANIYRQRINDETELLEKINETLDKEVSVEITSKLDTNTLSKTTFYYNFFSYTMLAGAIYVVCLILSIFQCDNIRKRTIISSMNYKKYNRLLLFSNSLFAICLWLIYVILSAILCGEIIFSSWGIIYIINSFVFTISCLTLAFLISNLITNKNAINGIINVVALGSSFLCGAFVPVEWLPDAVLKIAHFLPAYWYINTNERLKTLELLNIDALKPILINMGVILLFSLLFIILTNIISKKKRKLA